MLPAAATATQSIPGCRSLSAWGRRLVASENDLQGTNDGIQSLAVSREIVMLHLRGELSDRVDVIEDVAQSLRRTLRRH